MENKFKIIMLGDFSVGKTSLIKRYVENIFDEKYLTTIGVRVSKKNVDFTLNNEPVNSSILIWDIAGNDGLSSVIHQYIKGSSGAIITGDVTRKETLAYILRYHSLFRELCPRKPAVFALNKTDLIESTVLPDYLEKFKKETEETTGYPVFYTSAKTGQSVDELFVEIARLMTVLHE